MPPPLCLTKNLEICKIRCSNFLLEMCCKLWGILSGQQWIVQYWWVAKLICTLKADFFPLTSFCRRNKGAIILTVTYFLVSAFRPFLPLYLKGLKPLLSEELAPAHLCKKTAIKRSFHGCWPQEPESTDLSQTAPYISCEPLTNHSNWPYYKRGCAAVVLTFMSRQISEQMYPKSKVHILCVILRKTGHLSSIIHRSQNLWQRPSGL